MLGLSYWKNLVCARGRSARRAAHFRAVYVRANSLRQQADRAALEHGRLSATNCRTLRARGGHAHFEQSRLCGVYQYDEAAYERRLPSNLPRHKQTFYKGEHPPIIDSELWYKAQEIKATEGKINRMRNVRDGESGTAEAFSLTGILKCPSCGGGMHGKWTNRSMKNSEGYRYYFCGNRHDGGPEACAFPAIPATPLQDAAWNWLH